MQLPVLPTPKQFHGLNPRGGVTPTPLSSAEAVAASASRHAGTIILCGAGRFLLQGPRGVFCVHEESDHKGKKKKAGILVTLLVNHEYP